MARNYFAYNFIKIHRPLRLTRAIDARVETRLWGVEDSVALWEWYELRRAERAAEVSYIRFGLRFVVALLLTAVAFVIGFGLPLSVWWLVHGDPGMPGGAALAMLGFALGAIGALIAGLFAFVKLRPWKELSK